MLDKPGSAPNNAPSDTEFRTVVYASFKSGSERMGRMEKAIEHTAKATDKNTAVIERMEVRNDEMYEVFNAMKGGFKVLEWLGRGLKFFAAAVGAWTALCKIMGWDLPWPFK